MQVKPDICACLMRFAWRMPSNVASDRNLTDGEVAVKQEIETLNKRLEVAKEIPEPEAITSVEQAIAAKVQELARISAEADEQVWARGMAGSLDWATLFLSSSRRPGRAKRSRSPILSLETKP